MSALDRHARTDIVKYGKTFIGVNSAKFENEVHFMFLRLSLLLEMGHRAPISISENCNCHH